MWATYMLRGDDGRISQKATGFDATKPSDSKEPQEGDKNSLSVSIPTDHQCEGWRAAKGGGERASEG